MITNCFSEVIEESQGAQAVINKLNELAAKGGYVFRGYGKQDELLPKIIRDRTDYTDIEVKLLEDFERYGSNYFHATTPIDFMSYAQHFGLPTRLLDFTYNPFIALSFALYSSKSNGQYTFPDDKMYYYIRYAAMDENLCAPSIPLNNEVFNTTSHTDSLAIKSRQCIDSVTALFNSNVQKNVAWALNKFKDSPSCVSDTQEKIHKRTILFITPNQSNQRIIMQQGLFMFPYTLDKDAHLKILNNNSCYIMIHKNLRKDLIRYLDTLGYNTFRLMPDLSSICQAVKRRNLDERAENRPLFKKASYDF